MRVTIPRRQQFRVVLAVTLRPGVRFGDNLYFLIGYSCEKNIEHIEGIENINFA